MTARLSRPLTAAVILGTCTLPAAARDNPLATDRPDFVESSAVVGKGRLQIESSVSIARDDADGSRRTAWSTPTLVRFGINDRVELRVESEGAVGQHTATTERGYADVSLGMKWHVRDGDGAKPALALLLHADLSTGSATVREEGTRPSARVVAEWDLPNDMSLGVMPGVGYQKRDGGKVVGIFGAVLGKTFNPRLRGFVEVAAPRIARGQTEASLGAGVAYLVKKNVQIDAALSRGLNQRSPDLALSFGISFKL